MDDQSWEFFVNNSPLLVEKSKTKAQINPAKLDTSYQKVNIRKSLRAGSSSRVVFRNITPLQLDKTKGLKKEIKNPAEAYITSARVKAVNISTNLKKLPSYKLNLKLKLN